METRLALAACVALGTALCGRALADAARRRANTLTALVEALRSLRIHMTGMLEPVRCALERTGFPVFSMVARAMGGGLGANAAWRQVRPAASKRGGPADALSAQDLAALDGLFERLGQTGREEQAALLDGALEKLEQLRGEALDRAREAGRLYGSLGLLVGLMLALVVI